jgi:hypothetical protein
MKVYCPCGRRCDGYSGNPRKCERQGTSATMPQDFLSQSMDEQEGFFGKVFAGALGTFGSALAEKAGSKLSYTVYRCPACKCRVLTQRIKTGADFKEEQVAKIANC